MAPEPGLLELTEAELAIALEIVLRSDSVAIPVLKGNNGTC
jgi:hypothetical protein